MHVWAVLTEGNLHWHILKFVSVIVLSQDAHQYFFLFFFPKAYTSFSNFQIKLMPNPGLLSSVEYKRCQAE